MGLGMGTSLLFVFPLLWVKNIWPENSLEKKEKSIRRCPLEKGPEGLKSAPRAKSEVRVSVSSFSGGRRSLVLDPKSYQGMGAVALTASPKGQVACFSDGWN